VIEKSMRDIYQFLDEGGYLVVTNQPFHPQLEFIARF